MAGKAELVHHVVNQVGGVTKKAAGDVIDATFDFIRDVLGDDDQTRVQIPGFGTFGVSQRAARKGRNPRNGKEIDIPASKAVSFKAAKGLKDAVNG